MYRFGPTSILVDCGEPIDASYKASGLSYDLIDAIFLSHLHSDHVGGFFMLMQGFWLEKRTKPLRVYLPGGAIKPLREMLKAVLLFEELLPFRLEFRPLNAGEAIAVGTVSVTPFATSHLGQIQRKAKAPRDLTSYCFLIEDGKRRAGHSSDLGKPEDLDPLLAKLVDLLICELAHFEPAEIFRYLKGRDIKRVAFVHIARGLWEDLGPTRRLAAKMLPHLPYNFARDLDEIDF